MFSVCSHLGGGVPWPGPDGGGGTPPQVPLHWTWVGGTPMGGTPPQVPLSDMAGGTLMGGTPPQVPPGQTWVGGTPTGGTPPWVPPVRHGWGVPWQGVPHLGYPPVRPGWGVPRQGVPHLRYHPVGPGWGVPPTGGYPTLGDPPHPSDLAWGVPQWEGVSHLVQDNWWSTWYAAVGMPLAFTQEDFLLSDCDCDLFLLIMGYTGVGDVVAVT